MVPTNAREGDFVEVIDKGNTYFGLIGKIKQFKQSKITVNIYGKDVDIDRDALTLRARIGSNTYNALVEQVTSCELTNLDEEGYDGLIDFALENRDWEWAKDLVDRKHEYLARRKVR